MVPILCVCGGQGEGEFIKKGEQHSDSLLQEALAVDARSTLHIGNHCNSADVINPDRGLKPNNVDERKCSHQGRPVAYAEHDQLDHAYCL